MIKADDKEKEAAGKPAASNIPEDDEVAEKEYMQDDIHSQEAMISQPKHAQNNDSNETEAVENSVFSQSPDDHMVGTIISPEEITKENYREYFTARSITVGDDVYNRIFGRSFQVNDHIQLSELRYLTIPYYNFNGIIKMGEMIVNKKIARDVLLAFLDLYKMKYQFSSIQLIDDFWTGEAMSSDTASIHCNNTSCFNYRVSTLDFVTISPHGYGCAIDINPLQNPYVDNGYIEDPNAYQYADRTSGLPHVITHEDLCYKVFVEKYGFSWGGDWENPKDYQHFEKKVYEMNPAEEIFSEGY